MKILLTLTMMFFTLTSFANVQDSVGGAFYDSSNNTLVLSS